MTPAQIQGFWPHKNSTKNLGKISHRRCILARMITDETNNQNEWKQEDEKNGRDTEHRDQIIKELDDLQSQLTAQGVDKFYYYN